MKIFIVGTGNVAYALGKAFSKAGHTITGVFGRNPGNTGKLASKFKCTPYSDLNDLPRQSDLYILAVKDDAISDVVKKVPSLKGIVVHTSGTTPISVLSKFNNHGVFYPVETITPAGKTSFKKVPICLEASGERVLHKLMLIAGSVSTELYVLNSRQRLALHVAAVFTNNFTNHLLTIASSIVKSEGLPAELLRKLAASTVKNAFLTDPVEAQTGPARRNDLKTINNHLLYLKFNKEYQELYRLITSQIISVHNKIKK